MAEIVLGLATSHTPMLTLPAELWPSYARNDERNRELAFPPHGLVMPYQEGLVDNAPDLRAKFRGSEPYRAQAEACQKALDELIRRGYGDVPMDVPVASGFGRYLIEYLIEHDFDVAHMRYVKQPYGGSVARRYPTRQGELDYVRETSPREQGLPHAFAFIVKRLFDNKPGTILPVFQNTCYLPNQPTPRRSFAIGEAIANAVAEWKKDASVAVIASGGLSHFVVDERLDRALLEALERNDAAALRAIPREWLHSAGSETLNWIALGGAMQRARLKMELLDYVPVYRTAAGTGGGWAFARWR